MVNTLDSSSADHFDMTGNFSEDDIQHLLGAMNHAAHEDSSSNIPNPVPAMQAAVEAAAACLPPPPHHSEEPASSAPKSNMNTSSSSISSHHTEIDEEAKALARSERKRSREKQRRLDVNKQFTDLTKLISQIEQEEREEDPTVFRQSFSATNRADLIARTISHIERLRDSNKRRKTECSTMQQQLQESQKAGEEMASKYKEALSKNHGMMMPQQNKQVMMMVPMMMPANAAQSMPQFGMQAQMGAMNQFMMPQPFMAQPAAAQAPQQQQQAPQQPQQQQQQQQQQHAQAQAQQPQAPAQTAQPQAPTMMTPQQMMFTSMQSVYPNSTMAAVDPNATNAAIAATSQTAQAQAAAQMQMPFMNFQMASPAPTAPVAENQKTDHNSREQQQQQHQHHQQQQSSNGQGNSSAGGSNYAHCA